MCETKLQLGFNACQDWNHTPLRGFAFSLPKVTKRGHLLEGTPPMAHG